MPLQNLDFSGVQTLGDAIGGGIEKVGDSLGFTKRGQMLQTLKSLTEQGASYDDIARSMAGSGNLQEAQTLGSLGNAQWNRGYQDRSLGQNDAHFNAQMGLERDKFGFQKSQAAQAAGRANDPLGTEFTRRVNQLRQTGMDPNSAEGRQFLLTGNLPAMSQSTPEAQAASRASAARSMGLSPDSPAYQSYVLTGKMPREDQAPLTATDKKAILDADEAISTNNAVIKNLGEAKALSPEANQGWGANARAAVGNNLPDWLVPDSVSSPASSSATTQMNNLVTGNALTQLKAVFGAAPTEGERAILMELQGSASLPNADRQKIYDRAIELANRRLQFNQQRANELRGQTFYKPGGGQSDQPAIPGAQQPQGQQRSPYAEGTALRGPDGKMYRVQGGVPVPME